jgi:hypothetical protein
MLLFYRNIFARLVYILFIFNNNFNFNINFKHKILKNKFSFYKIIKYF